MRLFVVCSLLCLASFAVAQKKDIKFGDVSLSELTMNRYEGDTSAAAVILFDRGSAVLSSAATIPLIYKRHVRIKIFRKEAFDDWANENLYVERGSFSKLKGVTYNLVNDSIVKSEIDDNAVFKVRFNKYIDQVKFTLPNVKEGSVIEYSYAIKSDGGVPEWQFQYSIPVLLSEYSVEVPSFVNVRKIMKGTILIAHETVKNTETWRVKNVPAFKPEPLMPNKQDFISSIDFSFSNRSWGRISGQLWANEDFGGAITGSPFLKKTADAIVEGETSQKQKIIKIVEYMKGNVEWNGTEDIYAEDLREVFKKKKGTAADINVAMASLLHKAGINVEMVLLSTRGNGFARMDYPSTRQFDYTICIAYVDTVGYFLDATEKYLPWNVLPERCLNGLAFAFSNDRYRWIDIVSEVKSKTTVSADLVLNDAGELQGKLSFTRDGYAAYEMRTDIQKRGKDIYLEDFAKRKNSWSFAKSEIRDLDNIDKPVGEIHEVTIQEHGTAAGDLIYIDPFVTFKESENPFKEETREFPIDFGVRTEKVYLSNIVIPAGYVVDEMPQTKVMVLPENKGRFSYMATQIGNRITVVSNIQINARVFMQEEYPNLRELYNRIVAKHAEQIVLRKK